MRLSQDLVNQKYPCQLEDPPNQTFCWHEVCRTTPASPRTSTPGQEPQPTMNPNFISSNATSGGPSEGTTSPSISAFPEDRPLSLSPPSSIAADSRPDSIVSRYGSIRGTTYRKSLPQTPPSEVESLRSHQMVPTPFFPSPSLSIETPTASPTINIKGHPSSASSENAPEHVIATDTSQELTDDKIDHLRWEEFSPPKELLSMDDGLPKELADIVRDSVVRQWEAAKAAEERRRSVRQGSIIDDGPMLANESEGFEQAGLEVVPETPAVALPDEGEHSTHDRKSSRSHGIHGLHGLHGLHLHHSAHETVGSPTSVGGSSNFGAYATSVSSGGSGGSGKRTFSTIRTIKRTSSEKTITNVPVGPMGFMAYNASTATQERYVPPKLVSPWAVKIKKFKERKGQAEVQSECIVCTTELKNKNLIELGCKHKYCKGCFVQFVTMTMMDEASFPPRCCMTEVPPKMIEAHLSHEQRALLRQKRKEYSITSEDRWYCPSPACSKWIDTTKGYSKTDMKCPDCKTKICNICRGEAHADTEACPQDFALEATLQEGDRQGWQRCYKCRALVELSVGCRHMTCKCGAEFCYVCGSVWHTCDCTEADQMARQQEAQARRDHFDLERAEIAAAIAAVERAEEAEALEERRRENKRRADEEENRKKELVVRRRKEVQRREGVERKFADYRKVLVSIHEGQKEMMNARHAAERTEMANAHRAAALDDNKDDGLAELKRELDAKNQELAARMGTAHKEALEEMARRHQEEEDDAFVSIHIRLRGKPNREAREKAMTDKILATQAEERELLEETQRAALKALLANENAEVARLEQVGRERMREMREQLARREKMLQRRVWADGEWFVHVSRERKVMLEEEAARQLGVPPPAAVAPSLPILSEKERLIQDRPLHPLETEGHTPTVAAAAATTPKTGQPHVWESPAMPLL